MIEAQKAKFYNVKTYPHVQAKPRFVDPLPSQAKSLLLPVGSVCAFPRGAIPLKVRRQNSPGLPAEDSVLIHIIMSVQGPIRLNRRSTSFVRLLFITLARTNKRWDTQTLSFSGTSFIKFIRVEIYFR